MEQVSQLAERMDLIEADQTVVIRLLQALCKRMGLEDEVDAVIAKWERDLEERGKLRRSRYLQGPEEDTNPSLRVVTTEAFEK